MASEHVIEEKTLIFERFQAPVEGHVVDLDFGSYWMTVRHEVDPSAVWALYDYDFTMAGPKTIRVVLRPATQAEIDTSLAEAKEAEAEWAERLKPWYKKVLA